MNLASFVLAALAESTAPPAAAEPVFALRPLLVQNTVLFRSERVTAGGFGGGIGLELAYRDRYLLAFDASALVGLGNTVAIHLLAGLQRSGTFCPAAWLGAGALIGDRLEFLTDEGTRPVFPTWAVGVRGAPLRYQQEFGVFSVLELGAALDFAGGSWLELTVLRVAISL
jgi:hypothetical protein